MKRRPQSQEKTPTLHRLRESDAAAAARLQFELGLTRFLEEESANTPSSVAVESAALARLVAHHLSRDNAEAGRAPTETAGATGSSSATLSVTAKRVILFLLADFQKIHFEREWRRFLILCLIVLPPVVGWMLQVRPAIMEFTDLRVLGAPLLLLFATMRVVRILGLPVRRQIAPVALFSTALVLNTLAFLFPWRESEPNQTPYACLVALLASSSLALTALQYLAISVGPIPRKRERLLLAFLVWSSGATTATLGCAYDDAAHHLLFHLLPGILVTAGAFALFKHQLTLRLRRDLPLAVAKRLEELKI
jgi:hypothetical protein